MNVESFEELVVVLRNFHTWGERDGFDFSGAVHLLAACLDALRARALVTELEDLGAYLTEEQTRFVFQLAQYLANDKGATGGDPQPG